MQAVRNHLHRTARCMLSARPTAPRSTQETVCAISGAVPVLKAFTTAQTREDGAARRATARLLASEGRWIVATMGRGIGCQRSDAGRVAQTARPPDACSAPEDCMLSDVW
ncbi:hypothetical protein D3C72_895550 [compost metagenome]